MRLPINRCLMCNDILFVGEGQRQPRSDKIFCSSLCRGRYNRWLHNLHKHEAKATAAIKAIAEYLQHAQAQEQAAGTLARLDRLLKVEARANGLRGVK